MSRDVIPDLSLADHDCRDGWTTCGLGDRDCEARATAAGAQYVQRHGGEGYYCAPASTRTFPSGIGWSLLVAAVLLVGGIVLLRRRRRDRRREDA